jgi:1,4-alpha-glucan branching enzyme
MPAIGCSEKYYLTMPKLKKLPVQRTKNHGQSSALATMPAVSEVEFVLECIGAGQVYVCGDFNGWRPASLRMIGQPEAGLWEKRLLLPVGRHEYKFIVDGNWLHDPEARENVRNGFGSLNSVLEVQP